MSLGAVEPSGAGVDQILNAGAALAGAPLRPRRRGFRRYLRQYSLRECLMAYAFLIVPLLLFIAFSFGVMGFDFWVSFRVWDIVGAAKWVGAENYQYIWNLQPTWWRAIRNTLFFAAVVVPCQTLLGFTLAVIVNQNIRGKKFFRTAFYFPSVTSSVAVSFIALWVFSQLPTGPVNLLLEHLGWAAPGPGWYSDPNTSLQFIMGLNTWTTAGTYMIIFLAALQDVPRDLYEAAAIDGAGVLQAIRKITLPMIRPALFFVVATGFIGCMQVFDQAYIISGGGGGPLNSTWTAVLWIQQNAFNSEYGIAAAGSFMLFGVIFVMTLLIRLLIRQESY